MKCPSCGLENIASASVCDCGFPLGKAQVQVAAQAVPKSSGATVFVSAAIRLAWAGSLICAAFAMLDFVLTFNEQQSAPQQAALAAYTLAWAVIPYCLARALASMIGKSQA